MEMRTILVWIVVILEALVKAVLNAFFILKIFFEVVEFLQISLKKTVSAWFSHRS